MFLMLSHGISGLTNETTANSVNVQPGKRKDFGYHHRCLFIVIHLEHPSA